MKQLNGIILIQKMAKQTRLGKKEIAALGKILKTADVRLREMIAAILGKSRRLEAVDLLCHIVIKDIDQGVRTNGAISVLDIARRYKNNKKAIRYILNKAIHPLLLSGGRYCTSCNILAMGWVFMELLAIGEKIAVITNEDKDNIISAMVKYYKTTLNTEAREAIQKLLIQLGAKTTVAINGG